MKSLNFGPNIKKPASNLKPANAFRILFFVSCCLSLLSPLLLGTPTSIPVSQPRYNPDSAPSKPPGEITVTVPVSASVLGSFSTKDAVPGKGFFVIPPRTRAKFVTAECYQWTGDRLDSIEAFISTHNFVYDFSSVF
jgi:hypothetical protein